MAQRQKISLVLADVDGTLVNEQKILTERAQKAVSALHAAGIRFAITSGRPPRGMAMLFEPLHLETPIAGFNGGLFVKPDLSIIEQKTVPADIAREANGAMMLSVKLKINAAPTGDVAMGVGVSTVPVTKLLKTGDVTLTVPLSCFANSQDLAKTPSVLRLATSGTLDISVYDVRLIETKTGAACPMD